MTTHIDDVISAINLSLDSQTDNQIFNVCTGIETSSEEVIRQISLSMNKDLTIEQIEGYKGDQYHSSYNNLSSMSAIGKRSIIT